MVVAAFLVLFRLMMYLVPFGLGALVVWMFIPKRKKAPKTQTPPA